MAFNINAAVILSGPKNIQKVRSSIQKQLSGISTSIDLKVNKSSASNITDLNKKIQDLNSSLVALDSNAKKASASLSTLSKSVSTINTNSASLARATNNVNSSLSRTQKVVSQTSSEIEKFGKDAALAVRRFSAFTFATGAIFGFIRTIKNAISEAIDFQRELVRIVQVTGNVGAGIGDLQGTIDKLATGLGLSANKLLEVSRIFAQTGQSIDQVQKSLTAVARASLAPTFGDIEKTTEGVIAALSQFSISADKAESILGSLNAVSKKFAVESDDLISVIRRAGGVFAAASEGLGAPEERLRELISIFTAVRSTTRESADTIATGLRTIFTRIQRPRTIKFLEQFGVQLRATAADAKALGVTEGDFVGLYEAIRRVSTELGSLDTLSLAQVVEELGGVRQVGKLLPALREFSKAEEARKVALEGTKSISGDVALATQTLAVQIEKLSERFNKLIRDISQSDTFQTLAKFAIGTANAFITLADALRPILPLLTAVAGIKIASAAFDFTKGFLGSIKGGGGAAGAGGGLGSLLTGGPKGGGAAGASNSSVQQAVKTSVQSQNANSTILKGMNTVLNTVNSSIVALNVTMKSLISRLSTLSFGGIGGIKRSIPKFAKGGYVNGPSHANGGVVAELEGGEFVVPKKLAGGGMAKLKRDKPVAALFLQPGDTSNSEFDKAIPKSEEISKGKFKNVRSVSGNIQTAILDDSPKKVLQKETSANITKAISASAAEVMASLEFKPFDIDEKKAAATAASKIDMSSIEGFVFEAFTSALTGTALAEKGANFDFPQITGDQRDRMNKLFDRPITADVGDAKRSFTRSAISGGKSSMAKKILDGIKNGRLDESYFDFFNNPQGMLPGMEEGKANPSALKSNINKAKGIDDKSITAAFRKKLTGTGGIGINNFFALDTDKRKEKAKELGFDYDLASGGAVPGGVPVAISNGELQVPPEVAKKYLKELEAANSGKSVSANLFSTLLSSGASLVKGPGSGTSDSIKTDLPAGTFILNAKDTQRLLDPSRSSANKGGLPKLGRKRSVRNTTSSTPSAAPAPAPAPQEESGGGGFLKGAAQLSVLGALGTSLDFSSIEGFLDSTLQATIALKVFGDDLGISASSVSEGFTSVKDNIAGFGKNLNPKNILSSIKTKGIGGFAKSGISKLGSLGKGAIGGPAGIAAAVAATLTGPLVDNLSSSIFGEKSSIAGVSGFRDPSKARGSAALSTASGAASGAITGAALGSFIPVIGPIIGGIGGAIIGGITSYFSAVNEQAKFDVLASLEDKATEATEAIGELTNANIDNKEKLNAASAAAEKLNQSIVSSAAALQNLEQNFGKNTFGDNPIGGVIDSIRSTASAIGTGDGFFDKAGIALSGLGKSVGLGGERFDQAKIQAATNASADAVVKALEAIPDELFANAKEASARLTDNILGSLDDKSLKVISNLGVDATFDDVSRALQGANSTAVNFSDQLETLRNLKLTTINGELKTFSSIIKGQLSNNVSNAATQAASSFAESFGKTGSIEKSAELAKKQLANVLSLTGASPEETKAATTALENFLNSVASTDAVANAGLKELQRVSENTRTLIDALASALNRLSSGLASNIADYSLAVSNAQAQIADRTSLAQISNPFINGGVGRSLGELDAGAEVVRSSIGGDRKSFEDLGATVELGNVLPQAIKDTLAEFSPTEKVDNREFEIALIDKIPNFDKLPAVLQNQLRDGLEAAFTGLRQAPEGGLGAKGLEKILTEQGNIEKLVELSGLEAQALEQSINSLNAFRQAIVDTSRIQDQIIAVRTKAELDIVKSSQQFAKALEQISPSGRTEGQIGVSDLKNELFATINAGGAGRVGPAVTDVTNAGQLLARRQTLQNSLDAKIAARGQSSDPNLASQLSKEISSLNAALKGTEDALGILSTDTRQLSAATEIATKVNEARLTNRERQQLLLSKLAGAKSPAERAKILAEDLKPVIAAKKAQDGVRLSIDEQFALSQDLENPNGKVATRFKLKGKALEQSRANAAIGGLDAINQVAEKDARTQGLGETLDSLYGGAALTAQGETPEEKKAQQLAIDLANNQRTAIQGLADAEEDRLKRISLALETDLQKTIIKTEETAEAFRLLREQMNKLITSSTIPTNVNSTDTPSSNNAVEFGPTSSTSPKGSAKPSPGLQATGSKDAFSLNGLVVAIQANRMKMDEVSGLLKSGKVADNDGNILTELPDWFKEFLSTQPGSTNGSTGGMPSNSSVKFGPSSSTSSRGGIKFEPTSSTSSRGGVKFEPTSSTSPRGGIKFGPTSSTSPRGPAKPSPGLQTTVSKDELVAAIQEDRTRMEEHPGTFKVGRLVQLAARAADNDGSINFGPTSSTSSRGGVKFEPTSSTSPRGGIKFGPTSSTSSRGLVPIDSPNVPSPPPYRPTGRTRSSRDMNTSPQMQNTYLTRPPNQPSVQQPQASSININSEVVQQLNAAADKLASLPELRVRLDANVGTVNVVLNGASIIQQFGDKVKAEILASVADQIRGLIPNPDGSLPDPTL